MLRNISILLLAVLLYSCGLFPPGIEDRAADYYSFQVGHLPKAKYSGFLSPAYIAIADRDALAQLDTGMRAATAPSKRYSKVKADQVSVQQEGNFALTTVDSDLGGAFKDGKPTRWVRDSRRWYLFLGSDAEVAKYGPFPHQLTSDEMNTRRPETAPPILDSHGVAAPPVVEEQPAGATSTEDVDNAENVMDDGAGEEPEEPPVGGSEGEPPAESGGEVSGG